MIDEESNHFIRISYRRGQVMFARQAMRDAHGDMSGQDRGLESLWHEQAEPRSENSQVGIEGGSELTHAQLPPLLCHQTCRKGSYRQSSSRALGSLQSGNYPGLSFSHGRPSRGRNRITRFSKQKCQKSSLIIYSNSLYSILEYCPNSFGNFIEYSEKEEIP